MFKNGFLEIRTRPMFIAFVAAVLGALNPANSSAQAPPRRIPPAPLGTAEVVAGPVANPFGPPPQAIAPVLDPFSGTPQFFFPAESLPARGYPVIPYRTRRPTPFDTPDSSRPAPQNRDAKTQFPPATTTTQVAPPIPIGNLRLSMSERFMNRLIARDEQRPGEVRDTILGAAVSGQQTTATQLRLDLLPSAEKARGAFVLSGKTQSETTGVTPQAMVDVASQQEFFAVKDVFFDGMKLSTRHAVIHVRARNQTLGAITPLAGTLFGGIAKRIAYREAERRRPEAEAIARDRVAERVYPEFDRQIDQQLASANDQLESTVRRQLKRADLMPSLQQVSSTDTSISYSAQFGPKSNLESTSRVSDVPSDCGLNLFVHESLLNTLVAKTGLAGLNTTDAKIKAIFAPYESKSEPIERNPADPAIVPPGLDNIITEIEFDRNEPLSMKFEQGQLMLTIRAKFKPAGQDVIPALIVTIPYRSELVNDKIVTTPGKVKIVPIDEDDSTVVSEIAVKLISQAVERSLSKLVIDRALPASVWPFAGPVPRVMAIQSSDGWIGISVD